MMLSKFRVQTGIDCFVAGFYNTAQLNALCLQEIFSMRFRSAIFFATLCCVGSAFADGKGDNDPTNVRRVPKDGVDVPADREAKLRESLTILQEKIAQLQSKAATTKSLLPDVLIFERAVRVALDDNEFFSPKDIDKADQLLSQGSLARINCWLVNLSGRCKAGWLCVVT